MAFATGDNATFNNTAGGTITVAGGGVEPGSTTVSAEAGTYTFGGGSIGGAGSFTKSGAGTVILAAANTYAGGTIISGGVLEAASDAVLGDAAGPITLDGGTLQAGGTIDGTASFGAFTNMSNFGAENALDLGGGKSAYFSSGSLVVNVVPEPSSIVLAVGGLLVAADFAARRRTQDRLA